MKSKTAWFVFALAVLTAGGVAGWQAEMTRRRVAGLLPPAPASGRVSPVLEDRLAAARSRAGGLFTARSGLGQLARVYHANGLFAEALRCYDALQKIEPSEPRWLHLPATILAGYGDLAASIPLEQRACALAPDYLPAHLRLGDSLFKANRLAEAASAYDAALGLEHDNPYALLGLARLDLEAGQLDRARSRLEQVVSKTSYALGYDLIVSLYERLGLTQRATSIRAMAKASGAYRDAPDPWVDGLIDECVDPYRLSLAAGTVARNGDAPQALRLLQRAVAVAPDDVAVRFQLGTLLVDQGQLDAAQHELERCTVLAPDFADAWAHLTSLATQQGRPTAAAEILAEGLRHCPDSPGLHLMRARVERQAGREAAAIAEYQASINLRPNEADAYLELGQLYIAAGREPEAIREMTRALDAEPGNPVALGILAFHAVNSADEATARAWLERVRLQPRIEPGLVSRLVTAYQARFGRSP